MKWHRLAGVFACILLIISCFIAWAWYPDIQENFTGFYSKNNYYGKPGKLLAFFGGTGILFYLLKKAWSDRLNLIFSALCLAYAITSFLRDSSSYDGFVPERKLGIYLMLIASVCHLVIAVMLMSVTKKTVPVEKETV